VLNTAPIWSLYPPSDTPLARCTAHTGTFRPDRLQPICERFGVDYEAALENVIFARALNSEHQHELLKSLAQVLVEQAGCIKLVVVDSIMALFRTDYQVNHLTSHIDP
jgi:RecA/RadA recombinase